LGSAIAPPKSTQVYRVNNLKNAIALVEYEQILGDRKFSHINYHSYHEAFGDGRNRVSIGAVSKIVVLVLSIPGFLKIWFAVRLN
jgi:hypothetical protein